MNATVWFHEHGFHIFPVHGKEPAVPKGTSWMDYRCSRQQAARMRDYAVPLSPSLGVLDTDAREAELWVLQHHAIPDTPFLVETARGFHRYYRLTGAQPKFLHRDGHTLEFRNEGQYVVGPGSVHPSGTKYTALYWSWRWEDIPFFPADFLFNDGSCAQAPVGLAGGPFVLPEAIVESERHETLHKLMRALVAHGVPLEGALTVCRMENHTRCQPPLADNEQLSTFLRRAHKQKDRANFERAPKRGWELCGSLIETGVSVAAALVAVRSIDPTFDPETSE